MNERMAIACCAMLAGLLVLAFIVMCRCLTCKNFRECPERRTRRNEQ